MDSRYNFVDIIADDAKSDVLSILFDNATKGSLRCCCHHIGFIQDNEFVALGEQGTCLGEILDALTNDVNTTFVGGIKFEDP